MKEHGILFKGEMVRALLKEIKTQTRRIPSPQNTFFDAGPWPKSAKDAFNPSFNHTHIAWDSASIGTDAASGTPYIDVLFFIEGVFKSHRLTPRVQVGDVFWVRENWAVGRGYDDLPPRELPTPEQIAIKYWYGATTSVADASRGKWRPSIYMLRWMSRITLDVTNIHVEHVQDISDEDSLREGVDPDGYIPRRQFESLWDSINRSRGFGWESNPPVLVYKFTRRAV